MVDEFEERHRRAGIVSNQTPGRFDRSRPHASTVVCGRRECVAAASRWVEAVTGEQAHLFRDVELLDGQLSLFDGIGSRR